MQTDNHKPNGTTRTELEKRVDALEMQDARIEDLPTRVGALEVKFEKLIRVLIALVAVNGASELPELWKLLVGLIGA